MDDAQVESASADEPCPRCSQDLVARYRILVTGEEVWLCPECEAMWPGELAPPVGNSAGFIQFTEHMVRLGRPGLWSEIEKV